ncbi:MAG: S41 family peptidase, partial [Candidatus Eiseniibacteriota bacterium]
MSRRHVVLVLACASGLMLAAPTPGVPEPIRSHDFESDAPDSLPNGWYSRRSLREGYRIVASPEAAHGGRQGLVLEMAKDPPSWNSFGAASVRVDARPFRGRRVRLRGWGRFHQARMNDGRGQLWMRIDRVGGAMGAIDNMQDRPITTAEWKPAEITVNIDADADTIVYGALMAGHGRFDVDDLTLTGLGAVGEGDQAARPISDRGVENLAAFGRLASVVRFFHPSDEAVALDWNAFVIDHVGKVEAAPTSAALAKTLRAAFAPIAPTVKVNVEPLPAKTGRAALLPAGAHADSCIAWTHHGFGGSTVKSIYHSERLSGPLESGGDALPLGSAWTGTLGGGLHAQVPLSLAREGNATLPRPKAPIPARYAGRPEDWAPSGSDRATRLADVLLATGVLEHFYPYSDVVHLDMRAALGEAIRSAASATAADFTETLQRLSAHLHDGHGHVSGPGQLSRWLPLAFEFVGDDLAVVATSDSTAGARVGDVVTRVDGRPVEEVLAEQRARLSASTEGHLRFRLSQAMRMSEAPRTLTLRAPDGATREASFEPGAGILPRAARPDSIAELAPGIHYVDLDRVTDADWRREVGRIAKGRGLIFDLRGYPSRISALPIAHLTGDSVWSARWNVPVVRRPFMGDASWDTSGRWAVAPQSPRITAPVAFLIDGRAVSYAETWMGIIEAYHLGTIVGEPTAGTNGNVCSITLPGGYSMMYTGMKVLKHDGSRHHGVGIHPTVSATRTIAGL